MITVVYNGSDIISIKNYDTWRRTNTCEFRQICFYERQIPQSHGILYVNLRNDNFHRLPQLRGLSTATAVALEEAAMRWPWKKPQLRGLPTAAAWMNSPILFKAFGLLLQHPAARLEADAVSFEAARFEADAFFFTPLPAIFFPAACAGFLLSFFFLSTFCRTASKSSSPPPKQLMQTSAAASARSRKRPPHRSRCIVPPGQLSICTPGIIKK